MCIDACINNCSIVDKVEPLLSKLTWLEGVLTVNLFGMQNILYFFHKLNSHNMVKMVIICTELLCSFK